MELRIQNLENEISALKARNLRVEADKAWEASWFRIISLTAIIYCVAIVVLFFLSVENIFLNALVPAAGYFLSAQSLPMLKRWWMKLRNF